MGAGRSLRLELADRLNLPPETLTQVPKVTLSGGRRVMVEHHCGLLSYSTEIIEVAGNGLSVRVLGSGLCLRAMDAVTVLITGNIQALELEEGKHR